MAKISKIIAREILDSRGNPTVEVDVHLSDSSQGRAAVPSGASTGAHEALELRDGVKTRYLGKGVQKAVQNVIEKIQPLLIGKEASHQTEIDQLMIKADGTSEKKNFGANAILGVSMAVAKAQAASEKAPFFKYAAELFGNKNPHLLPVPLMNVINGGAHADNGLDIQEFMIVPTFGMKFSEALRAGAEIFHNLKSILKSKNLVTAVGDEGGFAPNLKSNIEALELLCSAIEKSGYKLGEQISLGLDVAATELFEGGNYRWEGKALKSGDLVKIYNSWSKNFPLMTIEDGLAEDDWAGWTSMTHEIGKNVQIVGDDLFVTNPQRLKMGIEKKAANALLVKVNQIGSLTETFDAIKMAHGAGFRTILSHRSGETEDSIIADLAVATNSHQIKTGSLCRSERTAKYNQLLRIEEILGDKAGFWGRKAFI